MNLTKSQKEQRASQFPFYSELMRLQCFIFLVIFLIRDRIIMEKLRNPAASSCGEKTGTVIYKNVVRIWLLKTICILLSS